MGYNINDDMNWIRKNERDFLGKYRNRFLLINKKKVVDSFSRRDDAIKDGNKRFGEENFLIFHVTQNLFQDIYNSEEEELLSDIDVDNLDDDNLLSSE